MFGARILLDSIAPSGARLTTFEVTFPRIVLAEFNTHRMFSRNSSSSRAIPVQKMLERVMSDPFIPVYWGKNQKGMQAEQELTVEEQKDAERAWLNARNHATSYADLLLKIGVHKQITNRLIEPWLWHTVIFTATEMSNYYALRDDKHAQPEIAKPTQMLLELYEASKPMELEEGEWHLPLVTNYELHKTPGGWTSTEQPGVYLGRSPFDAIWWNDWTKISAGRCARVSYLTHEGKRDLAADVTKHNELLIGGHMSPLEHQAQALTRVGWERVSQQQFAAWRDERVPMGNFWGWLQYRKTLKNEHDFSKLKTDG